MFSIIGPVISLALFIYMVIQLIIDNHKKPNLSELEIEKNGIRLLYVFIAFATILFANIIFTWTKIGAMDLLYTGEYVIVVLVILVIIKQAKDRRTTK